MFLYKWTIYISTENRLRSQWTSTPYKIKVNNDKLINLVIRIQLTLVILMPRFSNFLEKSDHQFSHVFIFINMFPETHGFVAMLVTLLLLLLLLLKKIGNARLGEGD